MNTNAGSAVVLDANGNTTSLYGMMLSYTADNRLTSINGSAAYTYNGLGERVMKGLLAPGTAGSYGFREKTVYTYDQYGKLLAELGSSGKVKQEYIYMNDELLSAIVYKPDGGEPILNADMDGDGAVGVDDYLIWYFNHYLAGDLSRDINADGLLDTSDYNLVLNCALSGGTAPGCFTASYSRSIYYAHNDHLGTPHVLTDEAGVLVWSATYDPFGEATVNDDTDDDGNTVTLNIRFPGQYYDGESELHYNYFRTYDPETGRYVTSDPLGLKPSLNTFAYVGSNPIRRFDFYGLYQSCSYWGGTNCEEVIPKSTDLSMGIGGCAFTTCVDYNSIDGYTNVSLPVIPSLGGNLSLCFEFEEPLNNEHQCSNIEDDPAGDLHIGVGRHLGVSTNGGRTCINIGLGISSPINYSFNSGSL